VARGYVPLLLLVAGIWGASFMFIEVAVDEMEPTVIMALRLVLAALVLVPFLVLQEGAQVALDDLRRAGWGLVFLGFVNAALPFTLIAWGQTKIDSSIAAIANAPVPIFVALLAIRYAPHERVSGWRAVGIAIGIVGVGVLVGVDPQGGWSGAVGTLAVVLAAVSYAVGTLYSQHKLGDSSGLLVSTASVLWGTLAILPFGIAQGPDSVPGWEAVSAVAMLGVVGTGVGLLLYLNLLERHGSARGSLVVYLLPPTALLYGAVFLDEPLRLTAILGLALILAGVALGSGLVRPIRRRQPVPAPTP
jgi:drug/metabolite transporter (DMT)-like permease